MISDRGKPARDRRAGSRNTNPQEVGEPDRAGEARDSTDRDCRRNRPVASEGRTSAAASIRHWRMITSLAWHHARISRFQWAGTLLNGDESVRRRDVKK